MRRDLVAVVLALSCGPRSASPPPPAKTPPPAPDPRARKEPRAAPPALKPKLAGEKRKGEEFPEFVPRKLFLEEGEELVYRIEWAGLYAGLGTMTVTESSEGRARIDVHVRSNRFVDTFYKTRDNAWSIVDTERSCSLGFHQKKHEGRYRAEEDVVIDYDKMVARCTYRRPEKADKFRKLPLQSPIQDALSCLYVLRAYPLDLGKEIKMIVAQSGKLWTLKLTPQEIVTLKLKLGRFRAYRTKPEARFPGLFAKKGDVVAWIDVETGTVLQTRVGLPIGWITVELIRATKWPPGRE